MSTSSPSTPAALSAHSTSTDAATSASTPVAPGCATAPGDPRNGRPNRPQRPRWPIFLVADLALVVVFATIGRASHGEDAAGMLLTAWPFMVGAVAGWVASRGARHPAAVIPTGLSVWVCSEVGGMVLRALTGQGTALPFVVVSIVVLGALLIGYRLLLVGAVRLLRR